MSPKEQMNKMASSLLYRLTGLQTTVILSSLWPLSLSSNHVFVNRGFASLYISRVVVVVLNVFVLVLLNLFWSYLLLFSGVYGFL